MLLGGHYLTDDLTDRRTEQRIRPLRTGLCEARDALRGVRSRHELQRHREVARTLRVLVPGTRVRRLELAGGFSTDAARANRLGRIRLEKLVDERRNRVGLLGGQPDRAGPNACGAHRHRSRHLTT